nr:hypothetical protein CFP56_74584 [Quercus suber]
MPNQQAEPLRPPPGSQCTAFRPFFHEEIFMIIQIEIKHVRASSVACVNIGTDNLDRKPPLSSLRSSWAGTVALKILTETEAGTANAIWFFRSNEPSRTMPVCVLLSVLPPDAIVQEDGWCDSNGSRSDVLDPPVRVSIVKIADNRWLLGSNMICECDLDAPRRDALAWWTTGDGDATRDHNRTFYLRQLSGAYSIEEEEEEDRGDAAMADRVLSTRPSVAMWAFGGVTITVKAMHLTPEVGRGRDGAELVAGYAHAGGHLLVGRSRVESIVLDREVELGKPMRSS